MSASLGASPCPTVAIFQSVTELEFVICVDEVDDSFFSRSVTRIGPIFSRKNFHKSKIFVQQSCILMAVSLSEKIIRGK